METPPPTPVGAAPRQPSEREVEAEAESFNSFFDQYQRGVG
jgi:hypothetical protein